MALTVAVWPVRDCGRFPVKFHEKLKRTTTLRIPLKPLLAIPRVGCWALFFLLKIIKVSKRQIKY